MDDQHKKAREQLEQELARTLEDGDAEETDPAETAPKRLSPRYEARIQTQLDPIVQETEAYRAMAQEIDDRYDRYLRRIPPKQADEPAGEDGE